MKMNIHFYKLCCILGRTILCGETWQCYFVQRFFLSKAFLKIIAVLSSCYFELHSKFITLNKHVKKVLSFKFQGCTNSQKQENDQLMIEEIFFSIYGEDTKKMNNQMASVTPIKVLIKSSHENLNVIHHRREGKVSKYPNWTLKFIRLNLARFSFFEMRISYKQKNKKNNRIV